MGRTIDAVTAIRGAIPTSRHARMLFDMVAGNLGERGWVETADGGSRRTLFVRDGDGAIVPWPLLRLSTKGRLSSVALLWGPPGASADPPPPRPGKASRLRGLGSAEVELYDGPHRVTVTYGDDGRWIETARSEDPAALGGAVPALVKGTDSPVELLAEFLAYADVACHGPGRVDLPVPLPRGTPHAWACGLAGIRDALFNAAVPWDARWVVADGYAGTAVAWGATREEALAGWRAEVERNQPQPPPPPKAPPAETPGNSFEVKEDETGRRFLMGTFGGWPADVPQPAAAPANTPAVLVPLAPRPAAPSPLGSWTRLIGARGNTIHAAVRRDRDGFTLVGERLVERIDLADLDEKLDAVALPERPDPPPSAPARAPARWLWLNYRMLDRDTRAPTTPSIDESFRGPEFRPGSIDGDRVLWNAARVRSL